MQRLSVVYFPTTNLDDVNNFRQKYNINDWKTVQPHITIVSPIPDQDLKEDALIQYIEAFSNELKAFPISLNGITKSADGDIVLQVQKGNDEIIKLRDKLYSRALAPYLNRDTRFLPHITLGHFMDENNNFDKKSAEEANNEAKKLQINIGCNFDNLNIIKSDGLSPVKIIKTLNLY